MHEVHVLIKMKNPTRFQAPDNTRKNTIEHYGENKSEHCVITA